MISKFADDPKIDYSMKALENFKKLKYFAENPAELI